MNKGGFYVAMAVFVVFGLIFVGLLSALGSSEPYESTYKKSDSQLMSELESQPRYNDPNCFEKVGEGSGEKYQYNVSDYPQDEQDYVDSQT